MAPRHSWPRSKVGAALLIAVLVAGCSWDAEEPGLFGKLSGPPKGWNSHNWPTAVPAAEQLADYLAVTDKIVR